MTEIENDLRIWMQERAARVHASPKILETDYRPRTRGWRPRLAIGGGVAAIAGTVAAVLSLAGGASTAFAGWSAQPTTASPAQLQAAKSYCSGNIPNPDHQRSSWSTAAARTRSSSTRAGRVHTDLQLLHGGAVCGTRPAGPAIPPVTPAAGQLFLWIDHTSTDNGQPYGTMIAQAGRRRDGANLTLTDGTVVTATVQNGWVVAWWPGNGHVASAQLTTPTGTQTQTFNYPCDIHNCGGGPHGGARWRARRRLIVLGDLRRLCAAIALAGVCVAGLAACGGSGHNQPGRTSALTNPGVRFADCVRTHGYPGFPDPGGAFPPGIKQSPAFRTAWQKCLKLEPPGTSTGKPINGSQRAAALAQVRCIREHGIPNFPDPTFPASGGELFPAIPGFNAASPAFRQAATLCGLKQTIGQPRGG